MFLEKSKRIFKFFSTFLFFIFLLSACGGADTPFSLVKPATNPGGSADPPGGGGGGSGGGGGGGGGQQGCLVNLTSDLTLEAQGGGTLGDVKSDPKSIPPIPLRFSFSGDQATVTMNSTEFPSATISLNGASISVKQKDGTQASGTFDPSKGSLTINNISFTVSGAIGTFELTGLALTTENIDQPGDHGNLSATGSRLDQDKKIKLVGGVKIPAGTIPGFADLDNAALVVTFDGSFDTTPDPSTCTGSGGGGASGLVLKEVVTAADGTSTEQDLAASNTLNFGGVFVPQSGTDNPQPTDTHFFKTKTLRVKNSTSSAVSGTVNNSNGFVITPNGSVNIVAGASQDFKITFGFQPVTDYSETNVPATKNVTASLSLGDSTISLAGVAKRAGPELTLVGTETNAPATVDLGQVPVFVTGSGASARMACPPPNGVPVLARKISIQNTGVRPLNIQSIHAPVDTDTDNTADPRCITYGAEFQRMALSVEGGASCQTQTISGRSYLTDHCAIPVGNGKVNFKVVYLPKNASTVRDNSKDTGEMTIPSDDPLYATTPLTLTLQASVSRDTSDLLALRKKGSSFSSRNGGNLTLNIKSQSDTSLDQVLELVNSSSDPLQNVELTLSGSGASNFQICSANAAGALSNCNNSNPGVITTIPAMAGTAPGVQAFGVKFINPPGNDPGPFPAILTVKYVPASTITSSNPQGANNTFQVTLLGTVALNPLNGKVKVDVEFISAFLAPSPVQTTTDSLDLRKPANANYASGALRLILTPEDPNDPENPIRNVQIDMPDPDTTDLVHLSKTERRKLIRVFTSRLSTCSASGGDCPTDDTPTCTDPESVAGPYQNGGCAFFYYLFANGGEPGKFNTETGEMTLPNLKIRIQNPYHRTLGSYSSTSLTDSRLKATLTTLTFNTKVANGVQLITEPRVSSLAIPASSVNSFNPCPPGWDPTDDASPKPEFTCYLSRTSSSSDAFMRGRPAQTVGPGEQEIVLSMVTRFSPNQGTPDFIPFFMEDAEMWVAIQGRMKQCSGSCD
jgi:hypothetical protein